MKTRTISVVTIISAVVLLAFAGCGGPKKTPPVPVGPMDEYRDPGYGFRIKFPQGWKVNAEVGKVRCYNAPGVENKFLDPTGDSPNGVVIGVSVERVPSPNDEKKRLVDEMTKMGFTVSKEESLTVGGKTGVRVPYTGSWSTNVQETGQHIYFPLDTLLYDVQISGFGDLFAAYKAVFDASIATLQFPKPVEKGVTRPCPPNLSAKGRRSFLHSSFPTTLNMKRSRSAKTMMRYRSAARTSPARFRSSCSAQKASRSTRSSTRTRGTFAARPQAEPPSAASLR